jgi:hypothetical protein
MWRLWKGAKRKANEPISWFVLWGGSVQISPGIPVILTQGFHHSPQFLQASAWDNTSIKPRPLPSTSSAIYHSSIILPFDAMQCSYSNPQEGRSKITTVDMAAEFETTEPLPCSCVCWHRRTERDILWQTAKDDDPQKSNETREQSEWATKQSK